MSFYTSFSHTFSRWFAYTRVPDYGRFASMRMEVRSLRRKDEFADRPCRILEVS